MWFWSGDQRFPAVSWASPPIRLPIIKLLQTNFTSSTAMLHSHDEIYSILNQTWWKNFEIISSHIYSNNGLLNRFYLFLSIYFGSIYCISLFKRFVCISKNSKFVMKCDPENLLGLDGRIFLPLEGVESYELNNWSWEMGLYSSPSTIQLSSNMTKKTFSRQLRCYGFMDFYLCCNDWVSVASFKRKRKLHILLIG